MRTTLDGHVTHADVVQQRRRGDLRGGPPGAGRREDHARGHHRARERVAVANRVGYLGGRHLLDEGKGQQGRYDHTAHRRPVLLGAEEVAEGRFSRGARQVVGEEGVGDRGEISRAGLVGSLGDELDRYHRTGPGEQAPTAVGEVSAQLDAVEHGSVPSRVAGPSWDGILPPSGAPPRRGVTSDHTPDQRRFRASARSISRRLSRSAMWSRRSSWVFPRPSPSSTLAQPSLK